ncbi:MAG: MarR family transcriptional regulator [Anaerolineae bacterium]|nr:MarR family transcriptional regulator [Anaerolineae bacterium]
MKDRPADMESRYREMVTRVHGESGLSALDLFRHLAITYHVVENLAEKQVSRYGLSLAKMRILWWLKMRDDEDIEGGGLLPSELSRFQGVTPNTMSSLLTSLRESGLIEQINHPLDRRKRIIRITTSGLDLLKQVGPEHANFLREMFADLSEEERHILITLLKKITFSVRNRPACDEVGAERPK